MTATAIITHQGEDLVPHTASRVHRDIVQLHRFAPTKPFIVKARGDDGVGAVGLYFEVVLFRDNKPARHTRYFVYGSHVYASSRSADAAKAGTWRSRDYGTLHEALKIADSALNAPEAQQFGRCVLVELTADDIATIESDGVPGARFRGQYRSKKDFGEFDFDRVETGKRIPSEPLDNALLRILNGSV